MPGRCRYICDFSICVFYTYLVDSSHRNVKVQNSLTVSVINGNRSAPKHQTLTEASSVFPQPNALVQHLMKNSMLSWFKLKRKLLYYYNYSVSRWHGYIFCTIILVFICLFFSGLLSSSFSMWKTHISLLLCKPACFITHMKFSFLLS